jgi:quercetin dioxygenase-like cupin family protein
MISAQIITRAQICHTRKPVLWTPTVSANSRRRLAALVAGIFANLRPQFELFQPTRPRQKEVPMAENQTAATTRMARSHQPGQAAFKAILSDDIDWRPFPAFPPEARLAVLVGQPSEPGPYLIRVKMAHGAKMMPHRHSEDRIYTVISGVFYIGLGDQFDADKLQAYPPGAVIVLPGDTSHFHWAKDGEYITQVTAIGPLGLEYLNSKDDPRNQGAAP